MRITVYNHYSIYTIKYTIKNYDFHNAPQKQYIILLDGEIEIETSLGDKKTFKGGDILLMEDVEGKGHKTKNLIKAKRKSVFIPIE